MKNTTEYLVYMKAILLLFVLVWAGCDDAAVVDEPTSASNESVAEPPPVFSSHDRPPVLLQGFYWDSPADAGDGEWWDLVRNRLPDLADDGFTHVWLPPAHKAQNCPSMGYDPFDYYDLGEYDQKCGTETWFGSRTELEQLVSTAEQEDITLMADLVFNHNSGGDLEYNPNVDDYTYTDFQPASGQYTFDYNNFHPSTEAEYDAGTFAGFPDLAHANSETFNVVQNHQQWLDDTIGFDAWRYDFVKGLNPWVVRELQQNVGGFGVGELWDGNKNVLHQWLNDINYTASVFDFPFFYSLQAMANDGSGNYDMRNLWGSGMLYDVPFHTVTFVENHDTDKDDPIVRDKRMAYATILTHEGLPTVFWKDYYNYDLARRGEATGIAQLIWVYQHLADGGTSLLHADQDLYMMQRNGSPGLVLVLNDHPTDWKGTTVNTQWTNTELHSYAWGSSVEEPQPQNKWTDGNGSVDLWAPPRGYAVYAPNGY